MDYSYALTPFLTWLIAGAAKFVVNSILAKKLAFSLIGYGGLPSNHSAIVASMTALIALKEGIDHPAFGVALSLAFIVILDASSLRRQISKQAAAINQLTANASQNPNKPQVQRLRERIGHTRIEIAAGILVGMLAAVLVDAMLING